MATRVFNFYPGPCTLPLSALEKAQAELPDYGGSGMSVMELSHRSPQFGDIVERAVALAKEIMGLGDDHEVLFMTGGASTQFALIPLNFLGEGQTAAYVDTGSWSAKAIKEAQKLGSVHLAASSKDAKYTFIPKLSDIRFPDAATYLHITSNNTIAGTEYPAFPETGDVPLVCDMSSDICSRRMDFAKFALIYAGAQKNLGPAGVTLVILRKDLLERCQDGLPTMFDYRTHVEKGSLFNTPPAFCIYMVMRVFEWLKEQGGLEGIEKVNRAKKDLIYETIDSDPAYFRSPVERESRSWMNVVFRLPSEDLEKKFVAEAKEQGLVGLKGHRSVGGIRVSLYNAMPLEGAQKVAELMTSFRKAN